MPTRSSFSVLRILEVALVLSLLNTNSVSRAESQSLRRFTINDSIELSQFSNPVFWSTNQDRPIGLIPSPDHRWALAITVKGVVATNTIESTIWLFDQRAIWDFVKEKSGIRPAPKLLAQLSATSNTPVITDVRWLEDCKTIAFLGKSGLLQQQIYVADIESGRLTQLTHEDHYVSGFDIAGDTMVYTTLKEPGVAADSQAELVDVTGRNIFSLLWRDRPLDEREESQLLNLANILHVVQNGREAVMSPTMEGLPLRLYYPILALSPDGRSLVTVAAVNHIPASWENYHPRFGYEELKLTSSNARALADDNAWKAAEAVVVNLESGIARPLVGAPAGRSLFFNFVPTKAIWANDCRHVLISNTFLPTDPALNSREQYLRQTASAVAIVDIAAHAIQTVTYFEQPPKSAEPDRHVSEVTWDTKNNRVDLAYASSPDNAPLLFHEQYRLGPTGWNKADVVAVPDELRLVISQDLNHAPVLAASFAGRQEPVAIWDPNPQLSRLALGKASLFEWEDKEGTPYRGILVLPPDYVPTERYPLVIQTHGYEPNKFFADGIYTTGSGGRALAAKGMIVLQMGQSRKHVDTPTEGQFQIEAFEGAVRKLESQGMIDRHRVGVIGFSFTVFHVLYALTHKPDLFSVASITDGDDLSYWLYLLWTDIPWAQQYAELMNGGAKPFGKVGLLKWAESAPGFNLEHVRSPLLISCLEKGTLVGSWDIYGGLRTLGKPVDLVWLRKEDAPHVLVQPHHRYLSQQEAVDWFDFWLNGREDNDSAKMAKYARWRKLRDLRDSHPDTSRESPAR